MAGPAARLTTATLGRPPPHPSDPSGPPHPDKGFEAGSGGWGQGQGVASPGSQLWLPASSAAILPPWGNWVVPGPPCPVPKQEGLKGSPHCCPFPREGGAWDALRVPGEPWPAPSKPPATPRGAAVPAVACRGQPWPTGGPGPPRRPHAEAATLSVPQGPSPACADSAGCSPAAQASGKGGRAAPASPCPCWVCRSTAGRSLPHQARWFLWLCSVSLEHPLVGRRGCPTEGEPEAHRCCADPGHAVDGRAGRKAQVPRC